MALIVSWKTLTDKSSQETIIQQQEHIKEVDVSLQFEGRGDDISSVKR